MLISLSVVLQDKLVAHHQVEPFPDGTTLISTPPPAAIDDYLDIVDAGDIDEEEPPQPPRPQK